MDIQYKYLCFYCSNLFTITFISSNKSPNIPHGKKRATKYEGNHRYATRRGL